MVQNMVWHHHFSTDEITEATSLTRDDVVRARKKSMFRPENRLSCYQGDDVKPSSASRPVGWREEQRPCACAAR